MNKNLFQVQVNPNEHPGYVKLPPEPEPPSQTQDESRDGEQADDGKVKGHWQIRLNSFQKLIFIKAFSEEKVSQMKQSHSHCDLICQSD